MVKLKNNPVIQGELSQIFTRTSIICLILILSYILIFITSLYTDISFIIVENIVFMIIELILILLIITTPLIKIVLNSFPVKFNIKKSILWFSSLIFNLCNISLIFFICVLFAPSDMYAFYYLFPMIFITFVITFILIFLYRLYLYKKYNQVK